MNPEKFTTKQIQTEGPDLFDELLRELQNANIKQTSMEWEENIPEDIWDNHFRYGDLEDNFKVVATGLDVDTRRWYETSITVIKIYGRFLGMRWVTNLFSEQMEPQDTNHTPLFFEMEEIQTTSYRKK